MPPRAKGIRLWLRPARPGHNAVWIIKDNGRQTSTGCLEHERLDAEAALQAYIHQRPADDCKGYVYFISTRTPDFPVKIGYTTRHNDRFTSIQIALPYELEILGIFPVRDKAVERAIHLKFSLHRMRGEWFKRTPMLMAFIEEMEGVSGGVSAQSVFGGSG